MIASIVALIGSLLVVQAPQGGTSVDAPQTRSNDAGASRPDVATKNRSKRAAPANERAVLDGLRWLVRHQNPDGSWSAAHLAERCDKDAPCADPSDAFTFTDRYDVGTTGLALLCFLRAGFGDESKQDIVDVVRGKRHNVGAVVRSGLDWLAGRETAAGSFSNGRSFLYNDALATCAFVEAYALTKADRWKLPAQHGIEFLQSAQRRSPFADRLWGWRFTSRLDAEIDARNAGRSAGPDLAVELADADLPMTAVCASVLRAAQEAGLEVSAASLAGANEFAHSMAGDSGAFGLRLSSVRDSFEPPRPDFANHVAHVAMSSALGISALIDANPRSLAADPIFDLAAKQIQSDTPSTGDDPRAIDHAYWYWGTHALFELDGPESSRRTGKYWSDWNRTATERIVSLQDHSERSCKNGGWLAPDRWSFAAGPIYTTAMSVLTLEVPFRVPSTSLSRVGAAAPAFRLTDVNGEPLELAKLRGKVVVLDVWSALELPGSLSLQLREELLERHPDRVVVIGISVPPGLKVIVPEASKRRRESWRWIETASVHDKLLDDYTIRSPGATIVIDADGILRGRQTTWAAAVQLVETLLRDSEQQPK